jgi:hypothetical protein
MSAIVVAPPDAAVLGIGLIAVMAHEMAGYGFFIHPAANLLAVVSGCLSALVILTVFGIWGFRLGSRDIGGDGRGGGQKRDDREPPPTPGGRAADDDRHADLDISSLLDLPVYGARTHTPEPAHSAPDRKEKVPAGSLPVGRQTGHQAAWCRQLLIEYRFLDRCDVRGAIGPSDQQRSWNAPWQAPWQASVRCRELPQYRKR